MKKENSMLIIIILMGICTASFSSASQITEIVVPLIVKHDSAMGERLLPLDMSCRFQGVEYRLPIESLSFPTSSGAEAVLARLIEASRQEDMKACLALTVPLQKDANPEEESQFEKRVELAVRLYSKLFSEQKMRLFYQILYETKRMFIFGQPGTQDYFFVILSEGPENHYYWDLAENEPFNGLLLFSVMNENIIVQKGASKSFLFKMPLTDSAYEYKIEVCFNGQIYHDNSPLRFSDPLDMAASMLLLRTIAVETGNLKELGHFYTPDSQKRFNKILDGSNHLEKQQLLAGFKKKPQVCFVIDNGPLYTIFFSKKIDDTIWLYTQDVIPVDNAMKLTNFRYNSFYTQIFHNDYFVKEFSKQILEGAAVKPALE